MNKPKIRWIIFDPSGEPIICGRTRSEATERFLDSTTAGSFIWEAYKQIGYTRRKAEIR